MQVTEAVIRLRSGIFGRIFSVKLFNRRAYGSHAEAVEAMASMDGKKMMGRVGCLHLPHKCSY